eukprot:m.79774 g.79774  ORF g.79774 m.79774 type:complete len:127 (+) comp12728_c0_seq3:1399-1779(+)
MAGEESTMALTTTSSSNNADRMQHTLVIACLLIAILLITFLVYVLCRHRSHDEDLDKSDDILMLTVPPQPQEEKVYGMLRFAGDPDIEHGQVDSNTGRRCIVCQNVIPEGLRFCVNCGTPISPSRR